MARVDRGPPSVQLPAPILPSWLAGCWEQRTSALTVEEHWMAPRGGMMLGMGRTTRGDVVIEYERMRIYVRGDSVVYHAQPSGHLETEFVSPGATNDAVRFTNPAHDFPQHVIYRRAGTDSLIARIEGTANGRARGIDFGYRRTPCPGS